MGKNNSRLFDENISITQDIPNPGFIRAKKNLSDQRIRYSEIGMAMTRQELNYLVRQSWYKVIQLRELNDVLQQEDSLLAQFVKTANLKYKTGESNLLEKTSDENKRQALLQEINLNNVGISTEMSVIQLLVNLTSPFDLQRDPIKALELINLKDSILLKNNPAWQQTLQAISIAEAEQRLKKAEKMPDFSLGYFVQSIAGIQDINGQQREYNNIPRFQGFQIGINVPIFSGRAYKSSIQASNYNREMRKTESEYYFQQIESQLSQLSKKYVFYKDHLEYFTLKAIPNAESILKNSTRAYQSGDIGYIEYMYAIQTNLDTRKSYLQALNDLNQTVISIQYLTNQ